MAGQSRHPLVRAFRYLVAFGFFPVLVGLAWFKAAGFDPYTMTMFPVKGHIEPTADYPSELRFLGAFLIVLGGGLAALMVRQSKKSTATLKDVWMVVWIGVMIALYGASYFVAANHAADRIAEESVNGSGTA